MNLRRIAAALVALAAACGPGGAAQQSAVPVQPQPAATKARIDLDLTDVEIYDALRAFAQKAQVNLDLAGPSGLTGTVTIHVRGKPWDEVLAQIASEHSLRVTTAGALVFVRNATDPAPETPTFTGAPITADFDDTPIRTAAKTIADLSGARIVVDDGVEVAVTMHVKGAPWDLALDHLVRKYGLRLVNEEGTIRIAKP